MGEGSLTTSVSTSGSGVTLRYGEGSCLLCGILGASFGLYRPGYGSPYDGRPICESCLNKLVEAEMTKRGDELCQR